jgi:RNA-dependent RNA polymerase
MGVIDPYNCLEEGEVFVQYCKNVPELRSKGGSNEKSLLKCDVLVTRNPCVHPGDVRKLKAVCKKELKDY